MIVCAWRSRQGAHGGTLGGFALVCLVATCGMLPDVVALAVWGMKISGA
jgi:hypothetical protein